MASDKEKEKKQSQPPHDLSLLLLRVVLGLLALRHGFAKFGGEGVSGFADHLKTNSVPFPQVSAWGATLAAVVCGACLIVGFCTRYAAIALGLIIVLAILNFYGGQVDRNELLFCTLAMCAVLFISGPGKYSVRDILIAAPKR